MGDPPDYEPDSEKSVAAIATRTGRTPDEVAYDYIIEENQYLYFPVVNYVTGDHEPKRGESLLLPLPCGLPYAIQRLGHAPPGLSPVRALLIRVPLGPCPWLRRLRRR